MFIDNIISGRIVSQIVIFPKNASPGDDIFRQNCHDSLDPSRAKTYISDLDRFAHNLNIGMHTDDQSFTLKERQHEFP